MIWTHFIALCIPRGGKTGGKQQKWKTARTISDEKRRKTRQKTKGLHLSMQSSVVDDTRLELVTSRTSSGCATSCANRPSARAIVTHARRLVKRFPQKNTAECAPEAKKVLTVPGGCAIITKLLKEETEYRGVEQLVARRAHNPEVVGSNPSPATTETA